MEVGQLGGLASSRVDHDHRPGVVGRDRLEDSTGLVEPVGMPRVLAHEHGDLGVVEVAVEVRAEHAPVDPSLSGLLLRQGIRPVRDAEASTGRRAVGPDQMVPLAPTPVVEDPLATVTVDHTLQAGSHIGDRSVPVDLDVGAVRHAFHRRREATRVVLVVVQPQRLLTGVALRRPVTLVATDAGERSVLDPHLDPAVAGAENAHRLLIVGHGGLLGGERQPEPTRTGRADSSPCTGRLRPWRLP